MSTDTKIKKRHKWVPLLVNIPEGYLEGNLCERCKCERYFKYDGDFKRASYMRDGKLMDLSPECIAETEVKEQSVTDQKNIRTLVVAWDSRYEEFPELEIKMTATKLGYESYTVEKIEREDGPSLAVVANINVNSAMFKTIVLDSERTQSELEKVPAQFNDKWLEFRRKRGVTEDGKLVYHIVTAFNLLNTAA